MYIISVWKKLNKHYINLSAQHGKYKMHLQLWNTFLNHVSKFLMTMLILSVLKIAMENGFCVPRKSLKNNSINLYVYAETIRQCLKNGRQKQNNIMLVGPTNCRKSFFWVTWNFMNPSATSCMGQTGGMQNCLF